MRMFSVLWLLAFLPVAIAQGEEGEEGEAPAPPPEEEEPPPPPPPPPPPVPPPSPPPTPPRATSYSAPAATRTAAQQSAEDKAHLEKIEKEAQAGVMGKELSHIHRKLIGQSQRKQRSKRKLKQS